MRHMGKLVRSKGNSVPEIDPNYTTSTMNANGTFVTPGFMGVFQTGQFSEFDQAGTFNFQVPSTVSRMRLRTMGRGGMGYVSTVNRGGCGGGFARGVFDVVPGENLTISIPSYRNNAFTEASVASVVRGMLLRATNGSDSAQVAGVGYGGDYQSTGGTSPSTSGNGHGGGAPGSQMALKGGNGGDQAGGGVYGNAAAATGGSGGGGSLSGLILPAGFPRFKSDGFWGSVTNAANLTGTPGCGANDTGIPGACGAMGYGYTRTPSKLYGGGGSSLIRGLTAYDLLGFVVLEW